MGLTDEGYRDSGSDIAYVLQKNGVDVVTPKTNPDPQSDEDWCFPDHEEGILEAVKKHRVSHLWANTILFSSHPLQTSSALDSSADNLKVVSQPPNLVQQYDDKNFVNDLLRKDGSFNLPKSWLVYTTMDDILSSSDLKYPVIAKPIRGRGSHGVSLCRSKAALTQHLSNLLKESSPAMLEEYLDGEEATVTVMPPSSKDGKYHALPLVVRFNHADGIAPYNGVVAVTANSRTLSPDEQATNRAYEEVAEACERVAAKLRVTAPIRIDVRQFSKDRLSKFAIFDVNMKPNMTGPGRPGREDQASLTALAAAGAGLDYSELLKEILHCAQPLKTLRSISV